MPPDPDDPASGHPARSDLLFVRHAPTPWSGLRYCGRSDPPLDDPGLAVARRLAADLGPSLPPDTRIVTSPLARARSTAEAIARTAGLGPVETDPRWAETDFGIAEGLTFEELDRLAPAVASMLLAGRTDIDWPHGEAAADLAKRVGAAWSDLIATPRPTLIVSHGGPIRIAVALARGVPTNSVEPPDPGQVIALERRPPH